MKDTRTSTPNDQVIATWMAWMTAVNRSPNTMALRRTHLRALGRIADLATATEADVVQLFTARSGQKPASLQALQASIRSFYAWAVPRGYATSNPIGNMPSVRVPQGLPKPIPEWALAQALDRADRETQLMLLLGAYAGLRLSEIASVHSRDVMANGLRVTGKGGKTRRVPIHPLLRPALECVNGWAFPSPVALGEHVNHEYVTIRLRKVLPAPYTPHSLRHRFASMAYRGSHDLRSIQTLLGHTSVATTQRYVMVSDDDLSAAVNSIAA